MSAGRRIGSLPAALAGSLSMTSCSHALRVAFCTSTTSSRRDGYRLLQPPTSFRRNGQRREPVTDLSRTTVLSGHANVRRIPPGRRSTSGTAAVVVTAVRPFSMSAGWSLNGYPGSTPPEPSRTVPVSEACANTVAVTSKTARSASDFSALRIARFPLKGVTNSRHQGAHPNSCTENTAVVSTVA